LLLVFNWRAGFPFALFAMAFSAKANTNFASGALCLVMAHCAFRDALPGLR
jgi:hypothetical protein